MYVPGLVIAAGLFYLYRQQEKKQKQEQNKINLYDFGLNDLDYNSTPLPDGLNVRTTLRIAKAKNGKAKARVYLYLNRTGDKTKAIYMHGICVNAYLFGKAFTFWNKQKEFAEGGYSGLETDYSVTYDPDAYGIGYGSYGRLFGYGEVEGLTDEQISQIQEAMEISSRSEQYSFATTNVMVLWSYKPKVSSKNGESWTKGIAQGIKSLIVKD